MDEKYDNIIIVGKALGSRGESLHTKAPKDEDENLDG